MQPVLSALSFLLSHGRTSASFPSRRVHKQIIVNATGSAVCADQVAIGSLPVKPFARPANMRSQWSAQGLWQKSCTLSSNSIGVSSLRKKKITFDLFTMVWHETERGSQTDPFFATTSYSWSVSQVMLEHHALYMAAVQGVFRRHIHTHTSFRHTCGQHRCARVGGNWIMWGKATQAWGGRADSQEKDKIKRGTFSLMSVSHYLININTWNLMYSCRSPSFRCR